MIIAMNIEQQWRMVLARDASADGRFFYAVRSTGIFCRPTCPSRRPRRNNVEFFRTTADAERAGYRACHRCQPKNRRLQIEFVQATCRYLDAHADEAVGLEELGKKIGISPTHLQKVFKRVLGISPAEYRAARRMDRLRGHLSNGRSVTDAMYDAGYNSPSRLYELEAAQLGMHPSQFRKQGEGQKIAFTVTASPLGHLLLAATGKGVCSIQFGESARELEARLHRQFAKAELNRDDDSLRTWCDAVLEYLHGHSYALDLPLDIQATAFQRRVWNLLRKIPHGQTRSYGEIARELGDANGARAVARACAGNPVALAVPCHRVVAGDGSLAGYRWGVERKKKLLARESQRAAAL